MSEETKVPTDEISDSNSDEESCNSVDSWPPKSCTCELCYLSREICEYLDQEKETNEELTDDEIDEIIENNEMKKEDNLIQENNQDTISRETP